MGADDRPDLADEARLAAEDLAAALDEPLRLVGRLDVLHAPGVGAVGVQRAHVLDHPLERPAGGAHALDGLDLDSSERIGLIFSAPPIQACAPPTRPPRRRYSSVSRQNQIRQRGARALRVLGDVVQAGAGARPASPRRAAASPRPPQTVRESSTVDAVAEAALGELRARLQRGVVRARDRAGQVDRDDVVAGLEQRLVARRGSRRPTAATSSAGRRRCAAARRRRRGR